jgi:hypothetical protein
VSPHAVTLRPLPWQICACPTPTEGPGGYPLWPQRGFDGFYSVSKFPRLKTVANTQFNLTHHVGWNIVEKGLNFRLNGNPSEKFFTSSTQNDRRQLLHVAKFDHLLDRFCLKKLMFALVK